MDGGRASGLAPLPPPSQLVAPETSPVNQNHLVGILMLSSIMFNLTDLATALADSARGLGGASAFLVSMPSALEPSSLASLVVLKAVLVVCAVVVALVGRRTGNGGVRKLAMGYLLISTSAFYLESLKNVFLMAV
jgi:hypothetical protein